MVMVMWFAWVIWEYFFLKKILQKAAQRPTKVHFFHINSGRNGDHEWLRMTNAFILCDLVWKVQKSHAANREGSFNGDLAMKLVIVLQILDSLSVEMLYSGMYAFFGLNYMHLYSTPHIHSLILHIIFTQWFYTSYSLSDSTPHIHSMILHLIFTQWFYTSYSLSAAVCRQTLVHSTYFQCGRPKLQYLHVQFFYLTFTHDQAHEFLWATKFQLRYEKALTIFYTVEGS